MAAIDPQEKAQMEAVLGAVMDAGATSCDLYFESNTSSSIQLHQSEIEKASRSVEKGLGIRAFVDGRSALIHTTDVAGIDLNAIGRQAVEMAKANAPDDANQLPEGGADAGEAADLDVFDSEIVSHSIEAEADRLRELDDAIRSIGGIDQTETVRGRFGHRTHALLNSNGIYRVNAATYYTEYGSAIVRTEGKMERGGEGFAVRHLAEAPRIGELAKLSAERALEMRGASQLPTGKIPVVFSTDSASMLLSMLFASFSGDSVRKGTSFLAKKKGERLGSELMTLINDPLVPRAMGSRRSDGEGVLSRRTVVVDQGIVTNFLYDSTSARKSGTASTSNASRRFSSNPSIAPCNFYLQAGNHSLDELLGLYPQVFLVRDFMGGGLDPVTGNLSTGASGVLYSNGKFDRPITGVTLGADTSELFLGIEAVGNDLKFDSATPSPSFLVREITVSGA